MSIPLDKIITYNENVYEMTSVAILEAQYLAGKASQTTEKQPDEKLVSKALNETLDGNVVFAHQED